MIHLHFFNYHYTTSKIFTFFFVFSSFFVILRLKIFSKGSIFLYFLLLHSNIKNYLLKPYLYRSLNLIKLKVVQENDIIKLISIRLSIVFPEEIEESFLEEIEK